MIGFRGTETDRARLEAEAKAHDLSLSEYIRRRLQRDAVRSLRKDADQDEQD
jgi:Mobilization protein NikA